VADAARRPARQVPPDAIVLSRGEVDSALGDFAKLAAAIHGRFSASGLAVDAVSDGSIFQRAGVRAGDVIASVDGAKLRSLDDAANVYARAPTASAFSVQILREGKPLTMHVVIQ
jgi:S1-C subfamily serine protease